MSRRTPMPLFDHDDLEARARAFHEANRHVFEKLRDLALEAKRAGVPKLGIAALFERLRWFDQVETRGDKYSLNNSFRSFYARELMATVPELRDFFETRTAAFDEAYHRRLPRRGAA